MSESITARPIIRREIIIKLGRLLNMRYRPAWLAEELQISVDTIYRSYLPAGAPHERDGRGRIWIPGPAFREWVNELVRRSKQVKNPLGDGEAWCLRCNKVVFIQDSRKRALNRFVIFLQGKCPVCGGKVNRAISGDPGKKEASREEG